MWPIGHLTAMTMCCCTGVPGVKRSCHKLGLALSNDLKFIAQHASAVLVGQLATMAFSITDTVVAARYSNGTLAALSIGSAVYVSVFVALMSIVQALMPVWAEMNGSRRHQELGCSFRQALYLCFATMAVGIALLLSPEAILNATEIPAALRPEVRSYLAVLALSLPPALLFRMFSTLNQSLGRPRLVTWLQIGSLGAKVPLSIWFALGGFGLQGQGAVGCAWATLVVNCGLLGVALWLLKTHSLYRPFAIWQQLETPHWRLIGSYARMGVPGGLAVMVEVTSFTLMSLFVARLGTVASASHQIASNLAAVMYMVPLSIAIAASSRVSYWLGAGQIVRARQAIGLGFTMAAACAVGMATLMYLARYTLAGLYTRSPDVVALAATLLAWVALYHLFDTAQALCLFFLRCFRVAAAPLVVYGIFLWGGGLAGGYWLTYRGLGPWDAVGTPAGFWTMSAFALGATALAFIALLRAAMQGTVNR
jgi:multidrug resistance protein, MATE family